MKIGNVDQIKQNLILYYDFDQIKNNKIKNVVNPSINEATAVNVKQVEGVSGSAIYLDGKDFTSKLSYVGVKNPHLNITNDMTVSVWAMPMDHNKWDVIIEKARASKPTRNEFMIGLIKDKVQYEIMDNNQWEGDISVGRVKRYGNVNNYVGKWTNFTLVYNNSEKLASLYINGDKVSSMNVLEPLNVLSNSGYLIIGADIDNENTYGASSPVGASDRFHGNIDEVRIYNKALNEKQIAILYNKYVPITYPSSLEENNHLNVSDSNTASNPVFGKSGDMDYAIWKDLDAKQLWLDLKAEADINGYQIKVGDIAYTVNLAAGERKRIFFEDVGTGDITVKIENKSPTAEIEKRSIIGYSTKTITFGDERATKVQIPVLDVTKKINIRFGKYERLMPNGKKIVVTVPAAVEFKEVTPTEKPTTESINIENPGKPERPNKSDYIDPKTGELDREAYAAAKTKYREALRAYKTALKTYKAAVKAAKLEAKGEVKSLKVEEKAIKMVNKALTRLVKSEQRADKYVARAEITLEKANNYRSLAEKLRTEAEERAEALLGKDWTMEELKAKLVKPNKSDYIDPETGKLDKDAYASAVAEYKEARAIAKLFKKADKYALRADRLEAKAELYQQKALDISAKSVDKLKATLRNLVSRYSSRAESLKATGEALLKQAESLEGADYYKALGKGKYSVELAEGYERGAEIATAVLETYVNIDVSVNPDVADSLESVDISSVNVSI